MVATTTQCGTKQKQYDMQSVSNIKQSERLLCLLGNDSTADYWRTPTVGGYTVSTERKSNSKPCWSVQALMDMLYEFEDEENGTAMPFINCEENTVYFEANGFLVEDFAASTLLIDNLIDAIEWQIRKE